MFEVQDPIVVRVKTLANCELRVQRAFGWWLDSVRWLEILYIIGSGWRDFHPELFQGVTSVFGSESSRGCSMCPNAPNHRALLAGWRRALRLQAKSHELEADLDSTSSTPLGGRLPKSGQDDRRRVRTWSPPLFHPGDLVGEPPKQVR